MILLDTHAALWMTNNDPAMGPESQTLARAALADGELAISAITFWELALLAAKGRVRLHQPAAELRRGLIDTGVIEFPLTGDIAILAVELESLHGDPADRFIVATAIVHRAMLVTADKALLRWRNKLPRQNASH